MKSMSDTLIEKIYERNAGFSDEFKPLGSEPFLLNKKEYQEKEAKFYEVLQGYPELYKEYKSLKVSAKDVLNMVYLSVYQEGERTGARLMLELIER